MTAPVIVSVEDVPRYGRFRHYWPLANSTLPVVAAALGFAGLPAGLAASLGTVAGLLPPELWILRRHPRAILAERSNIPRHMALTIGGICLVHMLLSGLLFHTVGRVLRAWIIGDGSGLAAADALPYGVAFMGLHIGMVLWRNRARALRASWSAEFDRRTRGMEAELALLLDSRLLTPMTTRRWLQ